MNYTLTNNIIYKKCINSSKPTSSVKNESWRKNKSEHTYNKEKDWIHSKNFPTKESTELQGFIDEVHQTFQNN